MPLNERLGEPPRLTTGVADPYEEPREVVSTPGVRPVELSSRHLEPTQQTPASAAQIHGEPKLWGGQRRSLFTEPTAISREPADFVRVVNVAPRRISFSDSLLQQWSGIVADHSEYYSLAGFSWLAAGIGVGALMANTGFDEHFIRHKYLENVVNISEDDFYEAIHQPHFLGDGRYTLPAFALAALAEPFMEELPYGTATAEWGQRSLRTVLVGGPPMLAAQVLTGASRPGESSATSKWRPLRDDNGVSGHSFMGAVPFMSAAKMTDNRWLKLGLYLASAAPAVSRVNDDKHYFSQAFLGWWMAYIAATAVDHSHRPDSDLRWFAAPIGDGAGLGVTFQH